MMKKIISLLLSVTLLAGTCLSFGACAKKNKEVPTCGGWAKTASPALTDKIREVVAKAASAVTDTEYTPIAYIANQVVAGMNHLVLCKRAVHAADFSGTKEHYVLLTIYEDLQGNAEITTVQESNAEALIGEGTGAWSESDSPVVTDELQGAFKSANRILAGAQYTPLALLGTQVVAGMNYCVLCEVTASVPDAASSYAIVHLYQDLKGKAEITETNYFTVAK